MNIGYDVDGVVVEIVKPMVDFLERQNIVVPKYEDTFTPHLTRVWKCNEGEVYRRIGLFYESPAFKELSPVEGVADAFRNLFPPHTAHGITARPEAIKRITLDFFEKHFENYGEIYHLGQNGDGSLTGRTKGQVAKELGLDLFVEDAPHNVIDVASYGIPVLLVSRPWNISFDLLEGVTRVDGWDDVLKYIKEGIK